VQFDLRHRDLQGRGDELRLRRRDVLATSVAPNFVGSCGTAIDVMVPSGCQLEYDVNTCCTGVQYIEVTWDVQACQAGTWVQVDSGADAFLQRVPDRDPELVDRQLR